MSTAHFIFVFNFVNETERKRLKKLKAAIIKNFWNKKNSFVFSSKKGVIEKKMFSIVKKKLQNFLNLNKKIIKKKKPSLVIIYFLNLYTLETIFYLDNILVKFCFFRICQNFHIIVVVVVFVIFLKMLKRKKLIFLILLNNFFVIILFWNNESREQKQK